jgi:hypothetical protein
MSASPFKSNLAVNSVALPYSHFAPAVQVPVGSGREARQTEMRGRRISIRRGD